ncbi:hypothetical protein M9Y10_023314 [Tritrichomonas musculus]|uniref:Uncharacterized protein n=1 Tax=Tritrichomonas musculus TaxID=1915356 RepID=A0ABR2KUR2_9EUKA
MKTQKETLTQALKRQRRMMSLNGVLNFTGVSTTDLTQLGSQKALKKLILDDSSITSLHTLPVQPNMTSLSANNTKLNTLSGLSSQPRITSISFIDTPISRVENFRLSVILAVGLRLYDINGVRVSKTERRMAKSFPPVAKYLVNAGWVVAYPPPSEFDFRYLADQFGIQATDDEFISPIPAIEIKNKSEELESDLQQKTTEGENEFEYDDSIPFTEQLSSILRPLGFAIRCGPEVHGDILRAISRMCEAVQKVEEMSKM